MNNTVRTFIAIPLNSHIREVLIETQDHLKKLDCNIKWVKPENIHLTLKFLGDVKQKRIDTIKQILDDLFRDTDPLTMELTQVGAFPNIDHPRILWIGLNDNDQSLAQIVSNLENNLGKAGFKKEDKPFSPHITIGRIRSPKNLKPLSEAINNYSLPDGIAQTIDHTVLYQSTLTSQGPIYEILQDFNFTAP